MTAMAGNVHAQISYLAAAFLLLLPYTLWIATKARTIRARRRLVKRGLCLNCGYDLRGSAGRCPECGLCYELLYTSNAMSPMRKPSIVNGCFHRRVGSAWLIGCIAATTFGVRLSAAPQAAHVREVVKGSGIYVVDETSGKGAVSKQNLVAAAEHGDVVTIKKRLAQGWDVNARNEEGETPLEKAAEAGAVDLTNFLITAGADVNARDWKGWTPLMDAIMCRHEAVVAVLLAKGADVNEAPLDGRSPLHVATAWSDGKTNVVSLLIENGARVNAASRSGISPISAASAHGDLDVVRFLIKKHANVNQPTHSPAPPLCAAAAAGKSDVIEFLISQGAQVELTNRDGRTPLHLAASAGALEAVKALVKHGAEAGAKDARGKTPLDLALEAKCIPVIDFLKSRSPTKPAGGRQSGSAQAG